MTADNERPYVDPAMRPGDEGTEPWADGEPPGKSPTNADSPADEFTDGRSAGLDGASANTDSDPAAT